MRPLLIGLCVAFVPLVVISLVMLLLVDTRCRHPSDETLARRFYAQETEFNELVAMAKADKTRVQRIAPTFTAPERPTAFSAHRWDDYRTRFERLGIPNGITIGDDWIRFFASDIGAFLRGTSKGYVYSQHSLEPCVPDLDRYRPQDRHHHWFVYRR